MNKRKIAVLYFGIVFSILILQNAHAEVVPANPTNYLDLVSSLSAGDTLQLEPGVYTQGLNLQGVSGDPSADIIISGPESGDPAVFHPRSCCNTVQLGNSSYLTIRYLTIDGLDMDYIDAVNAKDGVTHHITLENLLIINHGGNGGPGTDSQQTVGISTKSSAWNWVVRNNTIIGAGTGLYLGGPAGNYPFVGGLIEYNLIVDTLGYNMQIKHQNARPTNLGLPSGVHKTLIRHNVFSKANNASFGDWARPNLLLGHFPSSGTGTNDTYEVYGNFFFQNPSEALFQGEGNIALYNNIFYNESGTAVNIMPHNSIPKKVLVFHNTVVSTGTGIRVSGVDVNASQTVLGNAVFADSALSTAAAVTVSGNITDAYGNAGNYLFNPSSSGELDLYPVGGMLVGIEPDMGVLNEFTDWDLDFNGEAKDVAFRGAYSGEGSNPGWVLSRTIKDSVDSTTPVDPDPQPSPGGGNNSDSENGGSFSMLDIALLLMGWIILACGRLRVKDRSKLKYQF